MENNIEKQPIDSKSIDTNKNAGYTIYNWNTLWTGFLNLPQTNQLNIGIICFIKFAIAIIAFLLAWDCNSMSNILFRIIVTFFATVFGEIYIVYYSFYHVFMGIKCYV
jgi:hypothetical protein